MGSTLFSPFGHKLLQIYNDFVWTVSRLNRYMNNSLAAVRLPIRKPGPHMHNSRGRGPARRHFEVMTSKWFCFEEAFIYALITLKKKKEKKKKPKKGLGGDVCVSSVP